MTNLISAMPSIEDLGERFVQQLSALNSHINLTECQVLWEDVAEHYNEKPRAYHTLRHIQQLFSQFDRIKYCLNAPNIVALALYYHDVIYDPTCSDNEAKSAEYAVDKLERYISTEQCAYIQALIMMTAAHQLNDTEASEIDSDAAYFLDMDLSILGEPWSEYEHYLQAVRQEYAHVDINAYRDGRIAVLEELLAHPRLYLTNDYHDRLEQQARQNIVCEIKSLRFD